MPEVVDDQNLNEQNNGKNPPANAGGDGVNDRLLKESKEYKAKWQEAQKKIDEIERAKLEEQGNYKQLLEDEKKKASKLESELRATTQKTVKANILSTLREIAPDCVDHEALMEMKKLKPLIEDAILEDLSLDKTKLMEAVNKAYEEKPYLKKAQQTPGTFNGGKPRFNNEATSYKEMNARERANLKFNLANKS